MLTPDTRVRLVTRLDEYIALIEQVQANGEAYHWQRLPAAFPVEGRSHQCFFNCQEAATLDTRLRYVEGIAFQCDQAPQHHAWLTWDDDSKTVLDPTWPDDLPTHTYLGIQFETGMVKAHKAKHSPGTSMLWPTRYIP